MSQTLLFPDPKPLDQRLGKKFFRRVPRRPGVYLMKDASDKVLYVGKAKDLKQRLNNYRVANPDRMARRHLRMVREVTRIEFQIHPWPTGHSPEKLLPQPLVKWFRVREQECLAHDGN
ncbi:MAG: nucleotide excision repair endonuclease, partial [Limisphaerales bacterium]